MAKRIVHIILIFCFVQLFYPQTGDGVVAFDIPVRNSLKFNRHIINPTFSFVREQNKYLSFNNKREWVQFDDAPQTYLFGYAGRFGENMGAGLSLFQQNYGVMTTFGGVANFAYNAVFDRESNLTFGINLAFYKSGINQGNVVTNFPDSSLDDVPSNSLITVNPGINYGTGFFDFGVSVNNLVSYNLTESKMIEENPKQAIQGHIMYTGYVNSRGFFDESKFTSLLRSEFRKDETVISAIAMLTVPKGIWGQVGYNTLYGMSAGIGLNITSQIAIEYNYEKAMGDLSSFGNSHDITLAYKFKNRYRYNYSGDDDEQALLIPEKRKTSRIAGRRTIPRAKTVKKPQEKVETEAVLEKSEEVVTNQIAEPENEEDVSKTVDTQEEIAEEATIKAEQEEQARLAEEARIKAEQEEQARLAEEARIKAEQEEQARLAEEATIKAEQEEQARLAEEARIKAEQEEQARLAEEARIKAEQEEQARLAEEATIKAEQEEQARLAEEARIKVEQEEQARLAEEARIKAEQEEQARLAEEARIKAQQEEQARLAEEARIKAEQEEQARLTAEKVSEVSENDMDIPEPTDANTDALSTITKLALETQNNQKQLMIQLNEVLVVKEKDLKDLKEENDLSEQGIVSAPKPFKSVSAENAKLESIKTQLNEEIKSQDQKIEELEELYSERLKNVRDKRDETNKFYFKTINTLKENQTQAIQARAAILAKFNRVKVATEIERKRRIKRALYDNQEDRYNKDRAALEQIKTITQPTSKTLTPEDFDHGEELSNIQIVKGSTHVDEGYYLVVAVHADVDKRDEFLTKAVSAGRSDIDFFFDVNTSKYYIYYQKFDDINQARSALSKKGTEPYNSKMSMVKIEK
ncbi:PorP/SprF family type IX secretion system membrane protein [Flavobacteriaceae bacterium GSB9]|nr:PorP/SprF family type IX secretion system membrane protein [Flavobacteriaceae bacterium GSB9]